MYITKEELNRRLTKTDLLVNARERKIRGEEKRLTHEDRVLIGVLSEVDTKKNIADLVGVSQTTVSNVSRGLIAPVSGVDSELKKDIENKVQERGAERLQQEKKIEDQLITNLATALSHVANNINNTKAPEASKIALDMSRILNDISTSNGKNERGNKTAIIINIPSMKDEKNYSVVTV